MKIAIVCDWLVTFAGSERLLAEIIRCYPTADLYAVIDFLPKKDRDFLHNKAVKTTYIQQFPFAKQLYRYYLPWMPLAVEQLDFSTYDLVISSSHSMAKGIITGPNQIHISYIHSPMRYAWDMQHQYLQHSGMGKGIKSFFAKRMLHRLRQWDYRTAQHVDHLIANSNYIAKRILKTYRREASVIYPMIDHDLFKPSSSPKEDFYLAASRLVPYKRIDLIVETFRNLPDKKLIVIGDGPEMKKIKSKANNASNIEILGFQSNKVLVDYMQRAKAFIFAGEEDFGLILLEAQACGTPVIAYGKGGALETVRGLDHPQPTGIFFHEQNTHAIANALVKADQYEFKTEHCIQNAARFSSDIFRDEFKRTVDSIINKRS